VENIVVATALSGTPIYVKNLGVVQLGGASRRGLLDENGEGEVVGGIVVMRYGENAKKVIGRVKEKLAELSPGLPAGVTVTTAYDRSDLIDRAIDTLKDALIEEVILVTLAHILFLWHFRSILIVTAPLPLARKPGHREQHANQAAMKAHAALPDGKYLQRVREVEPRLVKQHIAQPPAQHHAEHAVEQHVFHVAALPAPGPLAQRDIRLVPQAAQPQQNEQAEGSEVGQPVPVDGHWPEPQRNGVDVGVDQHGQLRVALENALTRSQSPSRDKLRTAPLSAEVANNA
jgi:hypothetical protein